MSFQIRYLLIIILLFSTILSSAPKYDINDPVDKRMQAIFDTEDQKVLSQIALNDPAAPIRRTAVTKLLDSKLLAQIAENDVDEKVRGTAKLRLDKVKADNKLLKARTDVFATSKKGILFLPPKVRYICIKTDTLLKVDNSIVHELERILAEMTIEQLSQKGFEIQMPDMQNNPSLFDLTSNMHKLFYSQVKSPIGEFLKTIGTSHPNANFLALELKVKVGSAGTWNPMSGAISLNNSYSVVRAALLNPVDAKQLWKNQSLFREVPGENKTSQPNGATIPDTTQQKLKSTALEETISNIFANLTVEEKTGNE